MSRDSQLEAIYARIPKVNCKRKCQECCGPIGMSLSEFARIKEVVGEKIQPVGMGALGVGICSKTLTCPLLQNGQCSIYSIRPVICRIWGAVKAMRCPHGCRPKRWLSKEETFAMLAEAEAIAASP